MTSKEIEDAVHADKGVRWSKGRRGVWRGVYHCKKAGRTFIGEGGKKETARAGIIKQAIEHFAAIAVQVEPELAPDAA